MDKWSSHWAFTFHSFDHHGHRKLEVEFRTISFIVPNVTKTNVSVAYTMPRAIAWAAITRHRKVRLIRHVLTCLSEKADVANARPVLASSVPRAIAWAAITRHRMLCLMRHTLTCRAGKADGAITSAVLASSVTRAIVWAPRAVVANIRLIRRVYCNVARTRLMQRICNRHFTCWPEKADVATASPFHASAMPRAIAWAARN